MDSLVSRNFLGVRVAFVHIGAWLLCRRAYVGRDLSQLRRHVG
jgi:hypothetical protein